MKKMLVMLLALSMVLTAFGCASEQGSNASDKEDVKSEGVMTYAEYMAAPLDSQVVVETYVQAKQSWWEDKATVYTQDHDGAYFLYNMACSEEDYAKLTPGTKIKVTGYKSEWSGEVEITDATFELEDGNYVAPVTDVTALLGKDELIDHQNQFVSFKGMTVEASKDANGNEVAFLYNWDGSGEDGNDLYFNVSLNGQTYTFTVESYLCDNTTDVYNAVKNLKIGPSPKWMRERLASQGIRSINNLVDITNYVMEEYGQPMHAYDLSTIAGNKIVVRRAKDGDTFVTLDGQERKLDKDVLMICDGEKEVGIAGIMGGENSMVTDDIQTLLFEAACFDGTNIRLSSRRLGLATDAAFKFTKGLDPNLAEEAINRACQLIEEMGAGEVVGGMVDVYPDPVQPKVLPFEPEKINKLLGTDIDEKTMLDIFDKLELTYDEAAKTLTVPTFRQDLNCMADLAEEVARFYGYDKIPMSLPKGEATVGKKPYSHRIYDIARNILEGNGFSGGMCYSFESPKVFDKLLLPADSIYRKAITIANPLGEDFSIMRTVSLNGMLTSLATNFNRKNKVARLYEFGNVYLPKQLPLTELPEERMKLTIGMYGEGDFFNLKGVIEELFDNLGMKNICTYVPTTEHPFLHPGRQANIVKDDTVVGYLGQLHPEACDNYNLKGEIYVAVLDMPNVVALSSFDIKYEGIAKFPGSTRDLSMVMDKSIFVGQVEELIKKCGGKLLESYKLFDVYEGEQIAAGKKSVAYTMTFRAKDRTLEAGEVDKIIEKLVKELGKLGIELRA